MKYGIGQMVSIKINGKPGKAKIFGYEQDGTGWIYHLEIDEFDLDIKVLESNLIQGINIVTNGTVAKVILDDKAKAK